MSNRRVESVADMLRNGSREMLDLIGTATTKAPGTCGELAQGLLSGDHFLITCPIEIYSTVMVDAFEGSGSVFGPDACPKAIKAAELTLSHLGVSNVNVHLTIENPLPRGKGMASSTADVSASVQATAKALGKSLDPNEIARIALSIEPSDGVMFPGIAMFDHRYGKLYKALGAVSKACIVVLDFGGRVDTLAFNATDRRERLTALEPKFVESVSLIEKGLSVGDLDLIGQGATLSALANQEILPKPKLHEVIRLAGDLGAAGVNVAHSGTVMGMIFDDDSERVEKALKTHRGVAQRLEALPPFGQVPVGGNAPRQASRL